MRFASAGQVVLTDRDPTMVGNNDAIITVNDEALTASLRSLLDGVGYTGLANFDVMYDRRDRTNKVLEVNLRLGATSYYAMAAGGNIVSAMVEDCVRGVDLDLTVTTQERLWLNVPFPLAVMLAPRGLRRRMTRAFRAGFKSTLWYRRDLNLKRLLTVLRIDARHTVSTLKFARRGMNR